ncbi:MAG: DUF1285 domain-containing protein [Polyangiaceae bacterium]|nr:DUF1285 domain-containing protein [Polyangiaceae bacterium]
MRPGDDPEFFRLPAPEGRSRESTLRLDGEGRFFHEGALIERPAMARAFASWIARHPDDGRYILTNGYDWTYLTVDDVPFFVERARADGGRLLLGLSDGTEEPLDPATLRVGRGEAVYCTVKRGAFEARFTRAAQASLAPVLAEAADGRPALALGGELWPIE